MTPFESPEFLISQTRENLAKLDRKFRSLFEGEFHRNVTEIDSKTGHKTFKIKFTKSVTAEQRHLAATPSVTSGTLSTKPPATASER
jgi:hypothetical protein